MSWTWLRALDLDNHEALIRRPAHSGFAHLVYNRKKVRLGLELNYIGQRTDFNFSSYPAEKVNLPAHLLTSINLKFDLSEKLEAFLFINNLFNVRYELIYGYGMPGTTISTGFRLKLF